MGHTLENGIYLPSEGERNCYDGLASNWTTLDAVVGGYRAHVANEDIHITSEERSKWDTGVTQAYVLRYASVSLTALGTVAFSALDNTDNVKIGDKVLDSEGKLFALTAVDTESSTATLSALTAVDTESSTATLSALLIDLSKDSDLSNYYTKNETDTRLNDKADASALTAHTGDTTIHVTAADKQTWDTVTNKANDADAVHKSGAETIAGAKTFSDNLSVYNSDTSGATPGVNIRSSIIEKGDTSSTDTLKIQFLDKYNAYVTSISSVKNNTGSQYLQFAIRTTDNNNSTIASIINYYLAKSGDRAFTPYEDGLINLGTSPRKWRDTNTYLINSINPGALSLPDLNAGVDISAYITDLTGASNINKFTPTTDGWISIGLSNADFIELYIPSALMGGSFTKSTVNNYAQAFMPVIANKEVRITLKGSSIGWAKFYPCNGNV